MSEKTNRMYDLAEEIRDIKLKMNITNFDCNVILMQLFIEFADDNVNAELYSKIISKLEQIKTDIEDEYNNRNVVKLSDYRYFKNTENED